MRAHVMCPPPCIPCASAPANRARRLATAPARGLAAIALGLALAPGLVAPGCGTAGGGLRSGVAVVATDIYRSAAWSAELPVKAALPPIVRSVVRSYVAGLEVPDDVRRRLEERIDRAEFTDSTVPFLYYLSKLYSASRSSETFEQHVRAEFADLRATPGFEHALFRWEEAGPEAGPETGPETGEAEKAGKAGKTEEAEAPGEKPEKTAAPAEEGSPDPEKMRAFVMGGVVRVFDALFLEPGGDPMRARARPSPEVIQRASGAVRDLLRGIAGASLPIGSSATAWGSSPRTPSGSRPSRSPWGT